MATGAVGPWTQHFRHGRFHDQPAAQIGLNQAGGVAFNVASGVTLDVTGTIATTYDGQYFTQPLVKTGAGTRNALRRQLQRHDPHQRRPTAFGQWQRPGRQHARHRRGQLLDFGSCTTVELGGLSGPGNLVLANDAGQPITLGVGDNNANTTYGGAERDGHVAQGRFWHAHLHRYLNRLHRYDRYGRRCVYRIVWRQYYRRGNIDESNSSGATWNIDGTLSTTNFYGANTGANWGWSLSTLNVGGQMTVTNVYLSYTGYSDYDYASSTINVTGTLNATNLDGWTPNGSGGGNYIGRIININSGGQLNATSIDLSQEAGWGQTFVNQLNLDNGTLSNLTQTTAYQYKGAASTWAGQTPPIASRRCSTIGEIVRWPPWPACW